MNKHLILAISLILQVLSIASSRWSVINAQNGLSFNFSPFRSLKITANGEQVGETQFPPDQDVEFPSLTLLVIQALLLCGLLGTSFMVWAFHAKPPATLRMVHLLKQSIVISMIVALLLWCTVIDVHINNGLDDGTSTSYGSGLLVYGLSLILYVGVIHKQVV